MNLVDLNAVYQAVTAPPPCQLRSPGGRCRRSGQASLSDLRRKKKGPKAPATISISENKRDGVRDCNPTLRSTCRNPDLVEKPASAELRSAILHAAYSASDFRKSVLIFSTPLRQKRFLCNHSIGESSSGAAPKPSTRREPELPPPELQEGETRERKIGVESLLRPWGMCPGSLSGRRARGPARLALSRRPRTFPSCRCTRGALFVEVPAAMRRRDPLREDRTSSLKNRHRRSQQFVS